MKSLPVRIACMGLVCTIALVACNRSGPAPTVAPAERPSTPQDATTPQGDPVVAPEEVARSPVVVKETEVAGATSDAATPTGDPDRNAAELVLKARGAVAVTSEGKQLFGIDAVEKLPAGDFRVTIIGLNGVKGTRPLLEALELPRLRDLWAFSGVSSDIDDEGVKLLAVGGWRDFDLKYTSVTDAGLKHLAELGSLEALRINGAAIGDAGFEHLSRLEKLVHIEASGTRLTDAGMAHVAATSKLRELHINQTKVTDVGLQHIEGLQNLQVLSVAGTAVTPEGVERLKKALPNLRVLQ